MITIILLFLVRSAWSVASMCYNDQDVKCSNRGSCVYDMIQGDCYLDMMWGFEYCYDEEMCKCNIPLCNYIAFYEEDVCNNHGTCREKPGNMTTYCDCSFGYVNSFCDEWLCNNIRNTNISYVCNGKGDCEGVNDCSCPDTWLGSYCDIPHCIPGCLNNGDCVDPDNEDQPCDCDGTGFSGPICETPVCDPSCENGECLMPDYCNCVGSGYEGDYCEIPVCSSCVHGDCILPEDCDCHDNWDGPSCQIPLCDPNCKNGSCVYAQICECFPGYEGLICDKLSNCTPPCMFGECNPAFNNCTCLYDYTGEVCDIPTCDPPCTNGGNCTLPNNCNCSSVDYEGEICEVPVCNPKCFTGECSSPNNCSCDESLWTGEICDEPVCDPECKNGGDCYLPGFCDCDTDTTGWDGDICEIPVCFYIRADQEYVCGGNGNCSFPGNCECNETFWDGPECKQPKCFGFSNDENGCGFLYGNGDCVDPDNCECSEHFALPSCSSCLEDWGGEGTCDMPVCNGEFGVEACNGAWGNCTHDIFEDSFKCDCGEYIYGLDCLEKVGPLFYTTDLTESEDAYEIVVVCQYVIQQGLLPSSMRDENAFFCEQIIINFEDFGTPPPRCVFIMGDDEEHTQFLTFTVTDPESRYFNSLNNTKEIFVQLFSSPDLIIHVEGPREGEVPDLRIDDDLVDDDGSEDDDGGGRGSTIHPGELFALIFSLVGFSVCCVCILFCWFLVTIIFLCVFIGVIAFLGGGGGSALIAFRRRIIGKSSKFTDAELVKKLGLSDGEDDPFKGFAGTDDEDDGNFVSDDDDPFKGFAGTTSEDNNSSSDKDPFDGFDEPVSNPMDGKNQHQITETNGKLVKKKVLFKKKTKSDDDPFKGFEGTESSEVSESESDDSKDKEDPFKGFEGTEESSISSSDDDGDDSADNKEDPFKGFQGTDSEEEEEDEDEKESRDEDDPFKGFEGTESDDDDGDDSD